MPSPMTLRACSGGSSTADADARRDKDGDRSGQQPSRPRTIEPGKPNGPAARRLAPQQTGDQESGDDEEDVDPDEPAADSRHPGVKQHDGDDGDRAQPLDVRAKPLLRQSGPPARRGFTSGGRSGRSRNSVHSSNDRLTGPRCIPGSTRYVASQASSRGSFCSHATTSWPPTKETPDGGLRSDATNCLVAS